MSSVSLLARETSADCNVPPLSGSQMVGLTFVAEAGLLSLTADAVILILILFNLRRHKYRIRSLIQTPLDAYILSLISSDILEGLGSSLTVRWIHQGQISCGAYCTTQGTFQSLGATSGAMATLVIAIYTFVVIAFRRDPKKMWIPITVIACIWLYMILFVTIVATHTGKDVWNYPTPYWCWIGHQHLGAQLAGEYLWLWLAGVASIVLYVPLFFIVRSGLRGKRKLWLESAPEGPGREHRSHSHAKEEGTFTRPNQVNLETATPPNRFTGPPLVISPPLSNHSQSDEEGPEYSFPPNFSLRILLYPIAYTIIVLPISIVRWSSGFLYKDESNPAGAPGTFAVGALYYLSGFVNAFLVLYVRKSVSLLSPPLPEENITEVERGLGDTQRAREDDDKEGKNETEGEEPKFEEPQRRLTKPKSSMADETFRVWTGEVRVGTGLPDSLAGTRWW